MNPLRTWRHWRQRRRFEAGLDDELRFHLECRAEALRAEGLDAAQALRRARLELGAIESHKDGVRAAHGLAVLDAIGGELRRGLAGLLRAPLFLAGATAVLALAVALNLVLFTIQRTYLGTPPPTARAGALVDLELRTAQAQGAPWLKSDEAAVLRRALGETALHVALGAQAALGHAGDPPLTLHGMAVDAPYFRLLAARPLLGRAFEPADDADLQPRIVLGHAAWTRLFDADPGVIGRDVALGGASWTVVGVMPADFAGLEPYRPQFWVNARAWEDWQRRIDPAAAPARYGVSIQLAPGASIDAARAQVLAALTALPGRHVDDQRIAAVRLIVRDSQLSAADAEDSALLLVPLHALLLLVLLIACANLANLMLARALARRRELAIRASIGASRLRLVGLLLLEAGLLAAIGTALGLALALGAADVLHDYAASALSGIGMQALALRPSPWLLSVALGLALVATLAIGLVPALAATGGNLAQSVRADGGLLPGRLPPARLRAALMVAQVAASSILLLVAVFAVRVAHDAGALDVGYPADAIVDLRHPAPTPALVEEARRTPGVLDAAAIAPVPLYGHPWQEDVVVDGASHRLATHHADHRVREVFDLRVLAGRWFDEQEARDGAPLAVVGAATAAALWPGRPALGRSIAVMTRDAAGTPRPVPHEVIGVVEDVATGLLAQGIDRSALWLPGHAGAATRPLREVVLRIDPAASPALLASLSRACLRHPPRQPCAPWRLGDVAAWQRLPLEITRGFAVGIGLVALLISAAGLWGGVAYTVAARTHEIGVRRALGALRADVLRLVLGGTLRQVALGLAIALPACVALTAGLSALAGAGAAAGAVAFGAVAMLLLATAVVATALPARRAMAIAPTEALREG